MHMNAQTLYDGEGADKIKLKSIEDPSIHINGLLVTADTPLLAVDVMFCTHACEIFGV